MNYTETAPVPGSEAAASFDVENYLAERAESKHFVMVELGHESVPVAYQQPNGFYGGRAYIGIDAWMRDSQLKRDRLSEVHAAEAGDQNIFYVDMEVGGTTGIDPDTGKTWHAGAYDPVTLLPEGAADELLLSNVFSDPFVAYFPERTAALAAEAARLAGSEGRIVLRHTATPENVRHLTPEILENAGLQLDAVVMPNEGRTWVNLEAVYKGEPANHMYLPGSHYMFLSPIAEAKQVPEAMTADVPNKKHLQAADRIVQRVLPQFRANQLSVAVRAGRFGILETFHDAEVYALVAEQLLAEEERIEIAVHRIYSPRSANGTPYEKKAADVISAITMKDWPKYLPNHPIRNPGKFIKHPGSVEQIYPPQSEPESE